MKDLIIRAYRETNSYAKTARIFNITRQRVYQIVNSYKYSGMKGRVKKYKKTGFFIKNCVICKRNKPTVLHHIDFNNGNDKTKNLQPLCNKCHLKVHGRTNSKSFTKISKLEKERKEFEKLWKTNGKEYIEASRTLEKFPLDISF